MQEVAVGVEHTTTTSCFGSSAKALRKSKDFLTSRKRAPPKVITEDDVADVLGLITSSSSSSSTSCSGVSLSLSSSSSTTFSMHSLSRVGGFSQSFLV